MFQSVQNLHYRSWLCAVKIVRLFRVDGFELIHHQTAIALNCNLCIVIKQLFKIQYLKAYTLISHHPKKVLNKEL